MAALFGAHGFGGGACVGCAWNSSSAKREENGTIQSIKKQFGKKGKNEEGRKLLRKTSKKIRGKNK
jgi:hypothetical protein